MWSVIVGSFLFSVCASESLFADAAFARVKRQHQQAQHQQQAPIQSISYRPYQEAPDRIKQLLSLQQAREPLINLPAVPPPQLQQLQNNGQHRAGPAPQVPQQTQAAHPAQYSPNVQYGQAPQQPTYRGINAGQQAGPQPQHRAPQLPAQNGYTPQYKSQYNGPQQQPNPNSIYRPQAPPQGQYQGQSSGSFPKNLPPHIQKIIESQRSYQG